MPTEVQLDVLIVPTRLGWFKKLFALDALDTATVGSGYNAPDQNDSPERRWSEMLKTHLIPNLHLQGGRRGASRTRSLERNLGRAVRPSAFLAWNVLKRPQYIVDFSCCRPRWKK